MSHCVVYGWQPCSCGRRAPRGQSGSHMTACLCMVWGRVHLLEVEVYTGPSTDHSACLRLGQPCHTSVGLVGSCVQHNHLLVQSGKQHSRSKAVQRCAWSQGSGLSLTGCYRCVCVCAACYMAAAPQHMSIATPAVDRASQLPEARMDPC